MLWNQNLILDAVMRRAVVALPPAVAKKEREQG